MESYDVIVIGAGMVGAAIAYGLAGHGRRVLVLDGADTDYRAAKANFGLVWVQGKGHGAAPYQRLSRLAAAAWPGFAAELHAETGIAVDYEQRGGLHFCMGEAEWNAREARMREWNGQAADTPACTRMLDRAEVEALLPNARLGPDVTGASLGELDGHVNPLKLLAALHKGMLRRGATLLSNHPAARIDTLQGGGYAVHAGGSRYDAAQIVIAAGLGSTKLGRMVGLDVPLRPQRGQLLVTERLAPMLDLPGSGIRQTAEGTIMIGLTQEEVGYDLTTSSEAAAQMSRKALRLLPDLAGVRLVRHWSCLRIMTPDGCPVYAESPTQAGATIALCHSGVTLASFHAGQFANSLAGATFGDGLDFFHHRRFDVPTTA
jgi:glycine/D-amino acid oxidase-like deaminating enzyme